MLSVHAMELALPDRTRLLFSRGFGIISRLLGCNTRTQAPPTQCSGTAAVSRGAPSWRTAQSLPPSAVRRWVARTIYVALLHCLAGELRRVTTEVDWRYEAGLGRYC